MDKPHSDKVEWHALTVGEKYQFVVERIAAVLFSVHLHGETEKNFVKHQIAIFMEHICYLEMTEGVLSSDASKKRVVDSVIESLKEMVEQQT